MYTLKIIQDLSKGHDTKQTEKIAAALEVAFSESNSLSKIKKHLAELIFLANELLLFQADIEVEQKKWANKLSLQIKSFRNDLFQLAPWMELLPLPENFSELELLENVPSLHSVADMHCLLMKQIEAYEQMENNESEKEWLTSLRESITRGSKEAAERIKLLDQMADQCEQLSELEYDFLYNKATNLLRIGYNVDEQRKDNSYYDLLACEARLGIFVAISQGKLPQESWFALGRLLTNSGGDPILLSWSGSMFEYLMPQLVMPSYDNTLLYQTNHATVKRQIEYAAQREVPWGISESGYNMVDANLNYQYRAFGVPGLGLKRGLEEDVVIAPYASMLALMVAPTKACANLQLLAKEGFEGKYGFF